MNTNDKDEITVGFNRIFKILFCMAFYISIFVIITEPIVWQVVGGVIFCPFAFLFTCKCSTTGYYWGVKFFSFSFYPKIKLNGYRWEKIRYLDIGNLLRCVMSNFDELAELISRNKLIERETRQRFIDYVNKRKQQTNRLLPQIIEYAILLCLIQKIFRIIYKDGLDLLQYLELFVK